jgi:hypothetical protein
MGKTLLRADHEWVIGYIYSNLFDHRQRDYLNLKKDRKKQNYKNYIALILQPRAPENQK